MNTKIISSLDKSDEIARRALDGEESLKVMNSTMVKITESSRQMINVINIINDISGGQMDPHMFKTIGQLKVPYILMHMRGTSQTMQSLTQYDNLIKDVIVYFKKKVTELVDIGVNDIIIDPGFGFAKTVSQNYELLKNLAYFKSLNLPILVGLSRKSMIYKSLNTGPEEALNGTTVTAPGVAIP